MLPSKPGHRLSESGLSDYKAFVTHVQKWQCTCNPVKRCERCRHPGNPINLQNRSDAWERAGSTEAFDAIKGMI